jgi:hypothetical protein
VADMGVEGDRFAFDEDVWAEEVGRFSEHGRAHASAVAARAQISGRALGLRFVRASRKVPTEPRLRAAARSTRRSTPSRRELPTGSCSRFGQS